MSIVSLQEMLVDAQKHHYAVPMFDVSNTTMMRSAVEVAQEMGSPVILASLLPDIEGSLLGYWFNSAAYAARQVRVPVCLHLDHATDVATCVRCAELGYNSVMLDASAKEFAENVSLCAEVVRRVHLRGVGVEAELGHVASGITGSTDGASEDGARKDTHTVLTDPDSVVRFIEETHIDALAVSIGTTHGVYVSAPKLDIPLLKKLRQATEVPLVLHGGSGTPEDQLKVAIAEGIAKVNIYSELTAAWNTAMREFLSQREQMTCWFAVACAKPDAAMRERMREKMRLFGSVGRY